MKKIIEYAKSIRGTWLNKMDVWSYDEVVRKFRSDGYSWLRAQEKADTIFGVSVDPELKKIWRSI